MQKHWHLQHWVYLKEKKIDDYQNIYSVNHLYLIVANVSGYIKEKGKNKYLVF